MRASGRDARVGTLPMTRVGRAREFGETKGLMKVLVDADSRQILGASIPGMSGNDLVDAVPDVTYATLPCTMTSRAVHIHPTVSELILTVVQALQPLE